MSQGFGEDVTGLIIARQ